MQNERISLRLESTIIEYKYGEIYSHTKILYKLHPTLFAWTLLFFHLKIGIFADRIPKILFEKIAIILKNPLFFNIWPVKKNN